MFRAVVAEESEETRTSINCGHSLGEESCAGYNAEQLQTVLDGHSEVFSESPGYYNGGRTTISVVAGVDPINLPVRRIPFSMREGVREAVGKMERDGVIERMDDSSWCSPIVPVKKPDGSVRVCVDYRALNEVTPQIRHYMPTLEELLDKAGGCGVVYTRSYCGLPSNRTRGEL